ncbi:MAG: hypothetical protein QOJ20_2726 [Mycobacterium sp.]|jgi:hypothetical protein|nr:hypothetical protein [Mycobacterium sp.]MDT5281531.1 hypothetical protein [Mycobacterium sp.]
MNDSSVETNRTVGRPPQGGPPLSLLAAISLVLLLAGLVIGVALAGVMPLPYGSETAIQDYVAGHHAAAVAIAVGTFGSSIPLAIYAATASARLRQLGITAPGATIALAGGLLASAGLALSSLTAWTLSRPEVTSDAALVRALYYLTYLTGGPWHVVTLGLLIAGIAVPGLIAGLLPRPVAWTGLIIAGVAELTTLVLIWPGLSPLLPVARFTGLIWLIVAGALLPLRRHNRQEAEAAGAR